MTYSTQLLIIIVSFLWSTSALHERYVKPDNPSSLSCPDGQPCFTLDQYTKQAATYFTTGSTFLFLPGNHTLQTTINLTDIYNLKFKRSEEKGSTIHGNYTSILCMGVINLTIDGLTLKTTHLEVSESKGIAISNSIFLGNGTLNENSTSTLNCSNSNIKVINSHFEENTGRKGGAISIRVTNLDLINCTFIRNMAHYGGGAIYANTSNIIVRGTLINDFNNSGTAVNIFSCNSAYLYGGAIYLDRTNVIFGGIQLDNSVNAGGVIKSALTFQNSILFNGNVAYRGGAIYTEYGTLKLSGNTTFMNNSADLSGGAMHGLSSVIEFHDNIIFSHNSANIGGGMYLENVSLNVISGMTLNTSFNKASKYGGAIYYEDTLNQYQCKAFFNNDYVDKLPLCFIQLNGTELTGNTSIAIHSYHNTAGKDGSFMHGGGLDRCQLKSTSVNGTIEYSTDYNLLKSKTNFILTTNNSNNVVSSYPYHLCYCRNDTFFNFCHHAIMDVSICRGQKFIVSLLAMAQAGNHVVTTVTARTSDTSRLQSNQTYQNIAEECSSLVYNLYSTEDHERLTLHPDGPCSKESLFLFVTFLPCPPGFTQSNDECVCEQRLIKYATNCTIDEDGDVFIMHNTSSRFWITASYEKGKFIGVILCDTCPVEYCKTETIAISLSNPDMQCALNRCGVLCGACITNHSLKLGSSRCTICPNTYLALLLPFAAAGIALVVFLSILRLTVATGMINSVILYANIVQVNRHLFFPIDTVNVLTVFIAWMNLDLGIETCFYNGMTAYAKTWLQFAFPIYIWILITLIIITSRYSVRVSKLIGHNPIAVLATLLLMSYTKILKIIIDVYSYAKLEYPDNKTVTVWLKDGNITYALSIHFLLIVVTSLVLVFLFLPYTLLLLLGYKLYHFSGRKHMRWLNRLKPLLDSYYAPYNKHTRCWTGFLLLVRCALYNVFSFGNGNTSLLAIIITFVIIFLAFTLLPGKIYASSYMNIIESLVYFNVIILSAITFPEGPGANSRLSVALAYSLVGVVFVIMMGIVVYHIHTLYIAHSLVLRIQAKISKVFYHAKMSKKEEEPISENTLKGTSTTVTVLELREPLLEI